MEPSGGRVLLAVLSLSLAVCVLGRPQPSSASPQHSTVEVQGDSSLQGWNRISGTQLFGTLEVPWRRSLKRRAASRSSASSPSSDEGGGGLSTTGTIIVVVVVVVVVTFVLLLSALAYWYVSKKRKNPNWRPADLFKPSKSPREKMLTAVRSDVDPDAAAEHNVSMDMPRLEHPKSRKQVSLSHEY